MAVAVAAVAFVTRRINWAPCHSGQPTVEKFTLVAGGHAGTDALENVDQAVHGTPIYCLPG